MRETNEINANRQQGCKSVHKISQHLIHVTMVVASLMSPKRANRMKRFLLIISLFISLEYRPRGLIRSFLLSIEIAHVICGSQALHAEQLQFCNIQITTIDSTKLYRVFHLC